MVARALCSIVCSITRELQLDIHFRYLYTVVAEEAVKVVRLCNKVVSRTFAEPVKCERSKHINRTIPYCTGAAPLSALT